MNFDVEDRLMEMVVRGAAGSALRGRCDGCSHEEAQTNRSGHHAQHVGVGGEVTPKAVAQGVDAATQAMTPKHGPATAVDGRRPFPLFLAVLGWAPVCEL